MKASFTTLGLAVGLALLFLMPTAANASTLTPPLGVDFVGTNYNNSWGSFSLGFSFKIVNDPFVVNYLGFYDDYKNGLAESHEVGIWDASQTLLVSGTVVPGDPLISWWRWTEVPATTLLAGNEYYIAAVTGTENYTWSVTGFTTAPNVQYQGGQWHNAVTGALTFPESAEPSGSDPSLFGPNFATPEPSTLLLLCAGSLAIVGLRKRC